MTAEESSKLKVSNCLIVPDSGKLEGRKPHQFKDIKKHS